MRTSTMLLVLLGALAAIGCCCQARQAYDGPAPPPAAADVTELTAGLAFHEAGGELAARTGQADAPPRLAAVEPRKVVYTGEFDVVTHDVSAALKRLRSLAGRLGGYVQRLTGSGAVLRIPAGRFDDAVTEIEATGTVTRRDIQAADVTEKYADLHLRLANQKALLSKLVALLAKAETVKEALAVEQEVARVRTEVERLEGLLNRLKNRLAYATLAVRYRRTAAGPDALKPNLPFDWLSGLGLEGLTQF